MAEKLMTFYKGEDSYSDGNIENDILEYVKHTPESDLENILESDNRWPVFYHLSPIRQNIINWYNINSDADVLEIGAGMGAITGILCQKAKSVTAVELSDRRAQAIYERHKHYDNLKIIVGNLNNIVFDKKFDYITLIGVLEYAKMFTDGDNPYISFLSHIKTLLKPEGKLLLAIENQYGLKYFCGASEDHTNKAFDSLNGYKDNDTVRTFDKKTLQDMLYKSGLKNTKFYYPEPDYKFPNYIFTDKSLPSTNITSKIKHYYQSNSFLIADEKKILSDIIKNNTYDFFANSFLIEASESEIDDAENPNMIVFNNERKPEYRLITSVYDDVVYKTPISVEGKTHLYTIIANTKDLKSRGINIIEYTLKDNKLSLPFIKEEPLDQIIIDLILDNKIDDAKNIVNEFYKEILKSSELTTHNSLLENKIIDENSNKDFGPILKKGYIDMTFFNCFYIDGKFVFIDQEWVQYNVPAQYVLFRSFYCIWLQCKEISDKFNLDQLIDLFDINNYILKACEQLNQMLCNNIFRLSNIAPFHTYLSSNGKLKSDYDNILAKEKNDLVNQISLLNQQICDLNKSKDDLIKKISQLNIENNELGQQISKIEEEFNCQISVLNNEKSVLDQQWADRYNKTVYELSNFKNLYYEIINSSCWKFMSPVRVVLNIIKRIFKSNNITLMFYTFLVSLKNNGYQQTIVKIKDKLKKRYDHIKYIADEKELTRQRNYKFDRKIKFSILTPLYNISENFLREMIESVINQTYSNWELCLTDASDNEHRYVSKIVKEYSKKDTRIKYKKLQKNLGISENTNECIKMATGDYIGLLDHDDILDPSALFENMYVINKENADMIYSDEATFENNLDNIITAHFKPDFAIDNLRANNYICHFTVVSKTLLDEVGFLSSKYDGSQDHDLILRLSEKANHIVHIPKILYWWRAHSNSVAMNIDSKKYAIKSGYLAVRDHLSRCGMEANISSSHVFPSIYRIEYSITDNSKISIIIPNKDHLSDLKNCIDSILTLTTYHNYSIIIIDNNSKDPELFKYYDQLKKNKIIKIYSLNISFNYSKIVNYAVSKTDSKYFILLNNDTEVITPNWIEEMLMYAQRDDVGAVGAMLYFSDNTIQHAGIILGLGGIAGHAYYKVQRGSYGYIGNLGYTKNVTAVTAACMMVKKKVFEEVSGFDDNIAVAYNDVDFCMKIRQKGYLVVWTPYAELYHYESKSRGNDDTPKKQKRFQSEVLLFQKKWHKELEQGDPYYNPNFSLDQSYEIK